ncbi:MAG: flavin reductase [Spirochaetaceae bacterium]|nr:MAG: flavin reductase [Spirochaetaceae bacterium]
MKREEIAPSQLRLPVYRSWCDEGFLLTCGDHSTGRFNTMTAGWGSVGCMWKRPMAMVVVRPQRYTRKFMEEYPDFTICHFPPEHSEALVYCGSHSGRDVNKIVECGLTPIASKTIGSPAFDEADLIMECGKMYFDDLEPQHFLAEFIEENYPNKDYHRLYFGEIKAAFGTKEYGSWQTTG